MVAGANIGATLDGRLNGMDTVAQPAATEAAPDVAALFDAHGPFLHRTLARLTGSGPHVDEMVQDVFLTAHRQRDALRRVVNHRGWLYAVARRQAQHHRRSLARRRSFEERLEAPSPVALPQEAQAFQREQAAQVQRCLQQLPDKYAEVFLLYELEEMQGTAIAQLLGIPENTVWTRLTRARERFRKLWLRQQGAEKRS